MQVESHGWYWLVITRGEIKCQLEEDNGWLSVYQHHCRGKEMYRKKLNRNGVAIKKIVLCIIPNK